MESAAVKKIAGYHDTYREPDIRSKVEHPEALALFRRIKFFQEKRIYAYCEKDITQPEEYKGPEHDGKCRISNKENQEREYEK